MKRQPRHIVLDVRLLAKGGTSGIPEYTKNIIDNILDIDQYNKYSFFYPGIRKKPLPEAWRNSGNPIIDVRIPGKVLDLSSRIFDSPKFDRKIKADVFFSPHFNILSLRSAPRVITFHDLSFIHHPYFFSDKQKFWHWLQNYRQQAKLAKKLIAVSEFTKNDIINILKVPGEKIEVVYSGIDSSFQPASEENIQKFKIKKNLNFPFLLYFGTVEKRKNIEAIIRAFTIINRAGKFNELKLVIAGKPGWRLKHVLKSAKDSRLSDKIIFLSDIKDNERADLYSAAEVFLFPSFFEGFGFPPLEAQACGTPVVAADRTSIPEMLGDSALYVNPWNVSELAEKIIYLLENDNFRNKMKDMGILNSEKFNWQESARQTIKILENV